MFQDARKIPKNTTLNYDIAIIGGGAAGITIAREFSNTDLRIAVIESGGLEYDAGSQDLYEGELGQREYPLAASRQRYFGGSSNHWGGYTRPLDPIDFEARDWIPDSGWPMDRSIIDPLYPKAAGILQIGPLQSENPEFWYSRAGERDFDYPAKQLQTRFYQFSPPTRLGAVYRSDLERPSNLTVLLNANVTDIVAAKNAASVKRLEVRCLDGNRLTVTAKLFVLATGGLENPRLLLVSNSVENKGLGNSNDLVGRYFMEHPHLTLFCKVVVTRHERFPSLFLKRTSMEGALVRAIFTPREDFLRSRRLLNIHLGVEKAAAGVPEGSASQRMLQAAGGLLPDAQGVNGKAKPGMALSVGCACEQTPNPLSRVTLSEEQDPLGMPRIKLDWRLIEQERRSFVEHVRSLGRELGAMGMGRLRLLIDDDGIWPENVAGGSHHMGTTRMASDPKKGVVDADCRVHGLANLYIAGSSVFPTSGAANPTLSLVALALRLADHLKEKFHART